MVSSKENLNDHLSDEEKLREAEKMIEDGVPLTVICKVLKIPPAQLQHLGTKGDTHFKL